MRPNVQYTVLISTEVATSAGVTLSENYSWTFVTGVLNLTIPPPQQPGPAQVGRIRKEDLIISPRSTLNNDLHLVVITSRATSIRTQSTQPRSTSIFPVLLGESPLARMCRVQNRCRK